MDENGSDLSQVISLEVEGIKIALDLSKDGLRLAKQFALFLGNTMLNTAKAMPYLKKSGNTNMKNFKARISGQASVPYEMDAKTFKKFQKEAKKYGILYHAVTPLRSSAKNGTVHVLFAESDMASVQNIMNKIKDDYVRKNVVKGMKAKDAERDFNDKNSPETMQEYAENVGAMSSPETFHADMCERFGEDYEKKFEKLVLSNEKEPVSNQQYLDELAKKANTKERVHERRQEKYVEFKFEYEPNSRKSHVVEQTDTHLKVLLSENGKSCVWIPKKAVFAESLSNNKDKTLTAVLKENDIVLLQDIESKEAPYQVTAKEFTESMEKSREKAEHSVEKSGKKTKQKEATEKTKKPTKNKKVKK